MTVTSYYDTYVNVIKDPATRHAAIERIFCGESNSTMPMSFRKLIQADLSFQTKSVEAPLGDNRSVHIRSFMAATVGVLGSLIARIIRIAAKTIFLLPKLLIQSVEAARYGYGNAVSECLKSWGQEFVDLGIVLLSAPLGLIKTVSPNACSGLTEKITLYYLRRADHAQTVTDERKAAISKYNEHRETAKALRERVEILVTEIISPEK